MQFESKFEHGDEVTEPISGFVGVVEAIAFWRYGCVRIGIRARGLDKDGDIREVLWLDEPQIELVDKAKPETSKPAYGPRCDDKR